MDGGGKASKSLPASRLFTGQALAPRLRNGDPDSRGTLDMVGPHQRPGAAHRQSGGSARRLARRRRCSSRYPLARLGVAASPAYGAELSPGGARPPAIFLFACSRLAAYHPVPDSPGLAGFSRPRNVLYPASCRSVLPSSVAISVASVRPTFRDAWPAQTLGRGAVESRFRHLSRRPGKSSLSPAARSAGAMRDDRIVGATGG